MLGWVWAFPLTFILLGYLVPHFLVGLLPSQDLKKKYGATWALVTGASSGIGKSLAQKLAAQGLNVVLVALDEPLLDDTFAELKSAFPKLQFRKIGVNLGTPGAYLEKISEETKDIDVTLLFNNAGFMVTGFFDKTPLGKSMANVECNAVSTVQITHVFVTRMLAKQQRGCVVFTSSAAACQPCPFSSMYGATKAFVSSFGASLAIEVKTRGIDVTVVHPSPVASRFYDKAHALDSIAFFKKFNVEPDALPDLIFASVGRCVWRDIGGVAVAFRLMMKLIDFNLMSTLTAYCAPFMADFKKNL